MTDVRRIDACLRDPQTPLGKLIEQADLAARVNETLQRTVQAPWIRHVRFVKLRGDAAVVLVSSAAALTALRFQQPLLLDALNCMVGVQCSRIETRVAPTRD